MPTFGTFFPLQLEKKKDRKNTLELGRKQINNMITSASTKNKQKLELWEGQCSRKTQFKWIPEAEKNISHATNFAQAQSPLVHAGNMMEYLRHTPWFLEMLPGSPPSHISTCLPLSLSTMFAILCIPCLQFFVKPKDRIGVALKTIFGEIVKEVDDVEFWMADRWRVNIVLSRGFRSWRDREYIQTVLRGSHSELVAS